MRIVNQFGTVSLNFDTVAVTQEDSYIFAKAPGEPSYLMGHYSSERKAGVEFRRMNREYGKLCASTVTTLGESHVFMFRDDREIEL